MGHCYFCLGGHSRFGGGVELLLLFMGGVLLVVVIIVSLCVDFFDLLCTWGLNCTRLFL